jgi:hypothetical protein
MSDMSAVVGRRMKSGEREGLIPAEIRRPCGSNRFKVTAKDDHTELEPLVAGLGSSL